MSVDESTDLRSPRLGNMIGLFSGLTNKKDNGATTQNGIINSTKTDNIAASDKSVNNDNNDVILTGKSENIDAIVKAAGTTPNRSGSVGDEMNGSNCNKVSSKLNPNQKQNNAKKKSKVQAKLPHRPNTNYARKHQLQFDIGLNQHCPVLFQLLHWHVIQIHLLD